MFLILLLKNKLASVGIAQVRPNNYRCTYVVLLCSYGNVYLVTAGKISVAMDTTEELFRTDEEHR